MTNEKLFDLDRRRSRWEASQPQDVIEAARIERMARRRLKARLASNVSKLRQHGQHHIDREKVRRETRCVQIAHGFIRRRAYKDMEHICYTRPDWDRITMLILEHQFGDPRAFNQGLAQWLQEARAADNFKGYEPTNQEILDKLMRKRNKLTIAITDYAARTGALTARP
jgi:hypothetical protein